MQRFLDRAAAVFCIFGALLAGSSAQAQIGPAAAERLMRLSGMWEQLASMAPQFRGSLERNLDSPQAAPLAASRPQILAAADAAFQPELLRASSRRVIAESVRNAYLPDLMAWYQSAVGKRISLAEEEATAADATGAATKGPEDTAREGTALLKAAGPQRRHLLIRMVEVSRAGQNNADLMIGTILAVNTAMARFNPTGPQTSDQDARAALQEQRPALVQAMESLSLASFAVMYQTTSDEDLAAYLRFMGGAAGDHYGDIGHQAVEAALLDAFGALGKGKL